MTATCLFPPRPSGPAPPPPLFQPPSSYFKINADSDSESLRLASAYWYTQVQGRVTVPVAVYLSSWSTIWNRNLAHTHLCSRLYTVVFIQQARVHTADRPGADFLLLCDHGLAVNGAAGSACRVTLTLLCPSIGQPKTKLRETLALASLAFLPDSESGIASE